MATAHRLPATAAADPELDPDGLRSSAYGFFVCPPRALQPLVECVERKFAHSLRLVLPRITAPASRSRSTMKASLGGIDPASASDPAVVVMRSAVAMLSLMSTGMPCSGPRGPVVFRSPSSRSAMASASGFVSITLCSEGPCRSIASIRARYLSTSDRAVSRPDSIRRCRSAMVASSRSNAAECEASWRAAVSVDPICEREARGDRAIAMSISHGRRMRVSIDEGSATRTVKPTENVRQDRRRREASTSDQTNKVGRRGQVEGRGR